ncbi:MAG: hypothetical protein ACKN84_00625 [Candidatus Fonsibacter sp.]
MRFLRYKQVCRLHFLGSDDELKNVGSSFYKSQEKSINYNGQVNTKLLRFRLDSKMKNIKLKNPKIVLESVTFKDLYRWSYGVKTWADNQSKNNNFVTLRIKNISGDNWDSTQNSEGNVVLFRGSGTDITYINPSPKVLYNFTISDNFFQQSVIEFELIYEMKDGVDLNDITSGILSEYDFTKSLEHFSCSLIIYEEEEEELILKDGGNVVDFKRFGPTAQYKNIL